MTAQPGLGITGNGVGVTTPIAHRLAQSGLVAKAGGTPNLVRAGVFYDGTVNIVTGTAGMSYDVAPFTAALTRGAGQGTVLLANDGTVNVPTTAAPGSNSRIDIVYVWQRDFAIDGTDSNPVIGVVQGSPAATPAAPSLAAFPGALELARITVPAGLTATNSGATITQTAPFTAAAGAPIIVRNAAALPAAAVEGARARALDTDLNYEWNGSVWAPVDNGFELREIVRFTSNGTFTKASYPWLRAIRVRVQGGGGGGGGVAATNANSNAAGGGGYSGVHSESFITDIASLPSSVAVTPGVGGAAGAVGNAGGDGGASSFGSIVTAPGGRGGLAGTATTAVILQRLTDAITGGVGDLIIPSRLPTPGFTSGAFATSGKGADSPLGAGGRNTGSNTLSGGTAAGQSASGFGAGGGGAASNQSAPGSVGGAGAPGIVIVELFA